MTSGVSPAAPRAVSFLVALVTLIAPLAWLASGAIERPSPPPPLAAEAPVEVATVVGEPAPPEPAVVVALPPELESQPPIAAPPPVADSLPASFPRWSREERLTFLLLGVDRRVPTEIYRTDSIVLASLDLAGRKGTVVSIPRDLVVNIPGYGPDRINAVYSIGETSRRPGGGLGLLRETVEKSFGTTVHHYAVVDFNCFRGAVDALGGVSLTVNKSFVDPYYPTDDFGYTTIRFEAGRQWLSGEQALQYARSRYGDTDFGRMRRQQELLGAIREQALQVRSLGALPQALQACSGLSSDLNVFDLVALGTSAREIRPSDIHLRVIDEQLAIPHVTAAGASVLLPRWDEIRALVRDVLPGSPGGATASRTSGPAAASVAGR